ncbi:MULTISPECIES: DUF5709 domain-containing protein [Streptomyces]|uniref:DUF5709 domain-containing protein n=1 Tax=Streptomyces TaxID=1883 RepID=UPI0022701F61|nr:MULTISPECIES: DUF5709 domain-containing protein [unclassified Streptomyces]MCY0945792.1 DUF5709 domain-containing protein [Streptomyces sp. H34-AA3]MCY0950518.1 DUF5709 domain-containing protein [Streptomyces sp. H27-S2]MCZ4084046.1 DUF5709 domain-containing protein [Streptomyces sp. H34-S5]
MSDSDARGDDVYQPQPEDGPSEAQPDMDDSLGEPNADEMLDQGHSPVERPYGSDRNATTGEQQREGESLDERLARELPDQAPPAGDGIGDLVDGDGEPVDPQAGGARAGRLAPVTGSPYENNVLARDVGIDAGGASAEEAAVHVIEEP